MAIKDHGRRARVVRRTSRFALAGALCACALTIPLASVADASVLVVTSTADAGAGTLRDALAAANPGDTISIATPGDYLVTSAELTVSKDVSIEGSGPAVRIVGDGNNRVFNVTAANVTLSGMTVTGGGVSEALAEGGGIANATGTLVLRNVTVKGNSARNSPSGGIPQGGGVYNNSGTLQIIDSTISGNTVSIAPGGGGIPEGGGISNAAGSVSIIRSTISGNTASIAEPGGVPEGGGIESSGGQLAIVDSTVGGNTAIGGSIAQGGGIAAFFTTTTLTRTTVSGNAASESGASTISDGGGILQFKGSLTLVNSTIAANTAAGEASEGGGVEVEETTLETTNTTIASNVASGPKGLGGNLLVTRESTVKPQNTIVAGGTAAAGPNCAVMPKSAIQSQGHNLDSLNDCGFTAAGDIVNTDPLLGPLADNGGITQTMALAPSSPANDVAASAACPPTDQRGALRPAGAGCDIGAFELATPSATSGPASAVATTSATLNGLGANPDLAGASAFFQYGTTAAYGLLAPAQAIGPTTAQATITTSVGALTPGAVYHFRLVVQNAVSTVYGADQMFTTSVSAAPVLSGLVVRPSSVLPESGRGASIARKTSRPRGAKINYSDSAQATTTFTVLRARPGFRIGKRCLGHRSRRHAGKQRRCTRYVNVGGFTHADVLGANSFHFTGRVKGMPLPVGSYRLQARARNGAGQTSRTVTAGFRIIR